MAQFTQTQSVAQARILMVVIQAVLDSVMKESEEAVNVVTDALNNMSELFEAQRKNLAEALEEFYAGNQAEDFKQSLNDSATEIMEAAVTGDMSRVEEIGNSKDYLKQKVKTKLLHDNLQELLASSEAFAEKIMPLLIALQFQDKMKQQLVGVMRALDLFFARESIVIDPGLDFDFDDFWQKVQKGFNVVETRNTVLRIVKTAMARQVAS